METFRIFPQCPKCENVLVPLSGSDSYQDWRPLVIYCWKCVNCGHEVKVIN